ncbi:MAG TPA: hypothetical protein VGM23_02035 [Armatimonadota bacterium]
MDTIRLATEALIRLLQAEIDPHTLLVAADDVFEATEVPALLVQGPTLTEDGRRRTLAHWAARDQAAMTFTGGAYPRLYHLDCDLVVSSGTERALLTLIGKVALLYQQHPVLPVEGLGSLALTEVTPLGGLRRVNLSNLRQASGRLRLEDCPVGDDAALQSESGRLVGAVRVELAPEGTV